jgi:hypothetical protein
MVIPGLASCDPVLLGAIRRLGSLG